MESSQAKRNREKGAETEREIVNRLRDAGVAAEKASRSGYTGFDIIIQDTYTGESKRRKGGWPVIERWLQDVDFLFLRRDGSKKITVVMDMTIFVKLMGGHE